MPKGTFKDWTLEELQFIWDFDGSDGTTIVARAAEMGITPPTWYGIRTRLQDCGSPEILFAKMQESKKHRYNKASNGKVRKYSHNSKFPQTLEDYLEKKYQLTVHNAGRDSAYPQYRITIPPPLAEALLKIATTGEMRWEVKPNGILLVPVKEGDLK